MSEQRHREDQSPFAKISGIIFLGYSGLLHSGLRSEPAIILYKLPNYNKWFEQQLRQR
jgi:hypothetical protein